MKTKEKCAVSGCDATGYKKVWLWEGKKPLIMCLSHYIGFTNFVEEYGEGVKFKEERV